MADIFAHTVSRIDFIENMVRIELAILTPGTQDATTLAPAHVLHMPLSGFLRSAAAQEGFIGELAKRGVLTGRQATPTSPNFG